MTMKEYEKMTKRYNNCENVLLHARACAEAVIANMRKDGKENVSQADMQQFSSSNCTISKLKDFVKSHRTLKVRLGEFL